MTRFGALPPGQGRDALLAETRRVLDETLPDGVRVVVGLSGGPDSTALAYLLTEARPDLQAHVVHVRHGLRDDAQDAAVAAAHAAALGLAYHERAVVVHRSGEGPEASARQARYAALTRVAQTLDAQAVLVGHTADDQAETVLLNVARGTGLLGLTGMATSRPEDHEGHGVRVVRPLLWLRRGDVHAFVAGEGIRSVTDPTNRDPDQRRARARYELLPVLSGLSGGPGDPVGALTRLADLVRADAEALDELAAAHARHAVVVWGPTRAVRSGALTQVPQAIATRVVRLLLRGVRGGGELPAATVADVLDLEPGDAMHAPGGIWVSCGGGWLAAVPPEAAPPLERPVPVPGAVSVPEIGVVVRADAVTDTPDRLDVGPTGWDTTPPRGSLATPPPGGMHPVWTVLPVDAEETLVVRAARAGDRLGDTTVADLLGKAGVPRAVRALVPVVADTSGRVCWIPGVDSSARAWPPRPGRSVRPVRVWLAPMEVPSAPAGPGRR